MDLNDKSLKLTPAKRKALEALGIEDTDALLSYYPFRYDILNTKPFSEWKKDEKVFFECRVEGILNTWGWGRKKNVKFSVSLEDHVFQVTIFNRPWAAQLKEGQIITVNGIYKGADRITAISYDQKRMIDHDAITPVYSVKTGIQQRTIRDSIRNVYEAVQNEISDEIPEKYIRAYRLLRKQDALRRIHFPQTPEDIRKANRTLKYEEFLKYFTAIQYMRTQDILQAFKQPKQFDLKKIEAAIAHLSFALTPDQKSTLDSILADMSSNRAMYRLVQGDVGCGKTVVAALALYACSLSGYQSALLAPTEILARQHLQSVREILKDIPVRTEVLYSGLSAGEKRKILVDLENGKIDIIIGTHSLIQEGVRFQSLGLVIADEQQRFGVDQRKKLREKGTRVDFLLMSATPIPRTLASTLFGDMDVSTIETMPAGRQAPVTKLIQENSFRTVINEVNDLLAKGRQLYVICAAVDENEDYHARNVHDTAAALQKQFQDYQIGILHGRMSSEEKQAVMNEFYDNQIQILVSTTVVEVGMNVVNATGMIIYDADRFGLSQLHQLRGRIQRGSEQGRCWLLTGNQEERVIERLNVLVRSNNGFEISYEDLRLRGPGDILGTRQSGVPDFILGNLVEDTKIINQARKDAEFIVSHPDDPDHAAILDSVYLHNEHNLSYVD